MGVQRLGWAVFAPLTLVSWLLSHCLAYRLAGPRHEGHHALEHGAHGYMPAPMLLVAAALALVLAAFAAAVVASFRGHAWSRVRLSCVAAVPPLGFTVQEHVERLLETGTVPTTAALEPTFATGLVLQLPLVAAALFVARVLLATAKRLGRTLRAGRLLRLRVPSPRPRSYRLRSALAPRLLPLAQCHAARAPPLRLVAG